MPMLLAGSTSGMILAVEAVPSGTLSYSCQGVVTRLPVCLCPAVDVGALTMRPFLSSSVVSAAAQAAKVLLSLAIWYLALARWRLSAGRYQRCTLRAHAARRAHLAATASLEPQKRGHVYTCNVGAGTTRTQTHCCTIR